MPCLVLFSWGNPRLVQCLPVVADGQWAGVTDSPVIARASRVPDECAWGRASLIIPSDRQQRRDATATGLRVHVHTWACLRVRVSECQRDGELEELGITFLFHKSSQQVGVIVNNFIHKTLLLSWKSSILLPASVGRCDWINARVPWSRSRFSVLSKKTYTTHSNLDYAVLNS